MPEFTNTATLSYNGIVTNSNIAVGNLQEVLTAEKTAVSSGYAAGDEVTYIVTLFNSGGTALSGLTLTDDLGEYTLGAQQPVPLTYVDGSLRYYLNGVEQTAPTVAAGLPLVISGIDIPAGGTAMLVYLAEVNGYAPPAAGDSIINVATVSGGGISDVNASATLPAADEVQLNISKFITPATVTDNQQVTYSFIVQNGGNTATSAADAVVISDTFNPLLSNIAVTLNGTALTVNTDYTYDAVTGEFATVAGVITVPAATYVQDANGLWVSSPGVAELVITGTV